MPAFQITDFSFVRSLLFNAVALLTQFPEVFATRYSTYGFFEDVLYDTGKLSTGFGHVAAACCLLLILAERFDQRPSDFRCCRGLSHQPTVSADREMFEQRPVTGKRPPGSPVAASRAVRYFSRGSQSLP